MADPIPNPTNGIAQPPPSTTVEAQVEIPTTVILRAPSIYNKQTTTTTTGAGVPKWHPPPLEWLARTWTVTHSTLPMWRKAKNVRITYKLLPPPSSSSSSSSPTLLDDEVSSEPTSKTLLPQPKSIRGIDTPDASVPDGGAWNWRGRGWLRVASSHWEVLGWGEFVHADGGREGWVVTWFEKRLFTPAGVDFYSERRGGWGAGWWRRLGGCLRREGREGW
ncbi:hypothetical protein BKA65DRAFT_585813 [Rhexocercosporidium sp. MPI-PUGE-AT-0058]|nr:hypothetical protein BKA65DRAFT_585813 [Rhexocercosporidium sp. MPI-PUGE-AT-0058]